MGQSKRTTQLGIALLVALWIPCAAGAQSVHYNFMPGTDFSQYHTYKWVEIASARHPNAIVNAEIKQAIDSQLADKGLTKTDSDTADLYVGYQTAVTQQKQWNAWGTGDGFGFGGPFGGMETATSSIIDVGTIVIDMYDSKAKQLVWTGTATKTLDPSSNPEKNLKNLDKAMEKLLKDYPPK